MATLVDCSKIIFQSRIATGDPRRAKATTGTRDLPIPTLPLKQPRARDSTTLKKARAKGTLARGMATGQVKNRLTSGPLPQPMAASAQRQRSSHPTLASGQPSGQWQSIAAIVMLSTETFISWVVPVELLRVRTLLHSWVVLFHDRNKKTDSTVYISHSRDNWYCSKSLPGRTKKLPSCFLCQCVYFLEIINFNL